MIIATLLLTLAAAPTGDPWPMHVIDNTSIGADGVRLGDYDGDGHPDIATGWEEGGSIRVYHNPGPALVKDTWPSVVVGSVGSPEDAVLADLDGDGAMDVISCSEGKERKIWVHWAPANPADYLNAEAWKTEALPAAENKAQWMFSLPIDVDGKHGIDLVAGSKNEGAAMGWFEAPENPRELAAWQWHPLREASWVMSLISHDMDNDGDLDVVYTDRRGPKRGTGWLENPGNDGDWPDHAMGGTDHEVMFLTPAQFSVAGPTEWLCTTRDGGLLRFTPGDGTKKLGFLRLAYQHWKTVELPMPEGVGTGKGVAVGDLNGDRLPDIAVSCENADDTDGLFYLEQGHDGWNPRAISGAPGAKFDLVVLYDMDQDGDLDVLTCEERDRLGVIWYENPKK
ncbi:MAG: VCBS repeat-containing protein [Candidatus Hydrogenedentes bacterium]|nr:VCBS repeat-containing protein [Candidatus Hydrogenedentota bacterium]